MAVKEKVRIRLKAYDHNLVDQACERIIATAERSGAAVSGPIPLPTKKEVVTILRAVHKYKDFPRAVRDAHPQAPDRYHQAVRESDGGFDAIWNSRLA